MTRSKWLLVSGVVVVILVVWMNAGAGVPVRLSSAEQREMAEFVDERARTRLPQEYVITMPFDGIVEPALLVEGQQLVVGDELASVSARELAEALAEAQADVSRLQAAINENEDQAIEISAREQAMLFNESMDSTVAAAEERTMAGKAREDFSRTQLTRVESLFQSGAQTQEELDSARLAFNEGRHDHNEDKLFHAALRSLKDATSLLPRIISEQIARKKLSTKVMVGEKEQAEARLRLAEHRLELGRVLSPVNGTILARPVRTRRFLRAGEPLLRIGEMALLEVEMDLLTEEVARVKVGQPVEIYGAALRALSGEEVTGTVKRIYPAGFTKLSSLGVEQQRVTVVIEFDDDCLPPLLEAGLGVAYRVRARIITDSKANALTIPRSAAFRGTGQEWAVFVADGSRARRRPVQLGLVNDDFVEVTRGLEAGDQVIVAPESSLEDGVRIAPED